jgi:hypothetical protein
MILVASKLKIGGRNAIRRFFLRSSFQCALRYFRFTIIILYESPVQ